MTELEWDTNCTECNRRHMQLMWRRGDLGNLKRKAGRARVPDHGYADRLAEGKEMVADAEARFEEHLAEAHPDGIVKEPRKIADVRRKKSIPEGKVKCPSCGKAVSPVGTRLRRHKDKDGWPCPEMRVPGVEVKLTEAPPVQITDRKADVSPKGECRECGKWLPGERSICGRCSLLQGHAS